MDYITRNVHEVRAAIARAEQEVGRAECVRMVAAVKYAGEGEIEALLRAGVREVGENRVQQLLANLPLYTDPALKVHFIGTLQKNKVKYVVDRVDVIHSLDTPSLADEIEKRAGAKGRTIDVLVEINAGREEAKSGILPEEAEALCRHILTLPHLHLVGFMTMGPILADEAAYRAYFKNAKEMGDALWRTLALPGTPLYSMGMSQSFSAAIKEGADFVRVGRRLFQQEI